MSNEESLPESVLIAFEKVRQSGKCNMFDGTCVIEQMISNGDVESVVYLIKDDLEHVRVDSKKYGKLLHEVNKLYDTISILETD